jgi:hypothetical protein
MMFVFVVKHFHLIQYIQNCIAYSTDNEGSCSTFYLLSVDAVNHKLKQKCIMHGVGFRQSNIATKLQASHFLQLKVTIADTYIPYDRSSTVPGSMMPLYYVPSTAPSNVRHAARRIIIYVIYARISPMVYSYAISVSVVKNL